MFAKKVLTIFVALVVVTVLVPSAVLAQGPAWPYPPPGPGSWSLVSPQLSVDEGFRGQLVLIMRLTSNSQNIEQAQAIVTLAPDLPGYFAGSNSWGVTTLSGKYASWVVQLQPREDVTADILIQLQGVTSQQLPYGCLIATMAISIRDANGYWQPASYPLQLYKSW